MTTAPGEAKHVGRPCGPLKPVDERLELISDRVLDDAIARTPPNQYVLWNGRPALSRGPSLRARAIACVHEVGVPVSFRVLLQRAARLRDGHGLNPDLVRSAIRQHQFAKPAVLLLVEKRPNDEFVAVTDIPYPDGLGRPIAAREVIVPRDGSCLPGFAARTSLVA